YGSSTALFPPIDQLIPAYSPAYSSLETTQAVGSSGNTVMSAEKRSKSALSRSTGLSPMISIHILASQRETGRPGAVIIHRELQRRAVFRLGRPFIDHDDHPVFP